MALRRTFAALRWQIIRHGPNDERGFGLIAGLIAAGASVAVAVLGRSGAIDPAWLLVALSAFGLMWLLGPVLLPGSAPILNPQWFRTLPYRPTAVARAMAPSEVLSVGTVITTVALSSLVVAAAPGGPPVIGVSVIAAAAQLFFLLWLGRCVAAVVARLLRSTVGMWLTAFQMSTLLAISFAGWIPIAAVLLPDLGDGDTAVAAPSMTGSVPGALETALLALPTGWGPAAVAAATTGRVGAAVLPILGLLVGGLLLRAGWVALIALTLRQPPARTESHAVAGRRRRERPIRHGGPVRAATDRELATWFRDPHRRLGLGHAWLTPVLVIALIAPTNWTWALPFVGVLSAVFGAMVAVNTYALDGTALWQLLTTPGAIRADVAGRQLAWLVLFGAPALTGTAVLCLVSQSPLWAAACGAALAATGAACASAPLLSLLMPGIGADARDRVSTADRSGNAAGGEWTIFPAVVAVAVLPVVIVQLSGLGSLWPAQLVLGAAVGIAAILGLRPLCETYLRRTGPALLSAIDSGDITRLRSR